MGEQSIRARTIAKQFTRSFIHPYPLSPFNLKFPDAPGPRVVSSWRGQPKLRDNLFFMLAGSGKKTRRCGHASAIRHGKRGEDGRYTFACHYPRCKCLCYKRLTKTPADARPKP
jgi:hypothetical protein